MTSSGTLRRLYYLGRSRTRLHLAQPRLKGEVLYSLQTWARPYARMQTSVVYQTIFCFSCFSALRFRCCTNLSTLHWATAALNWILRAQTWNSIFITRASNFVWAVLSVLLNCGRCFSWWFVSGGKTPVQSANASRSCGKNAPASARPFHAVFSFSLSLDVLLFGSRSAPSDSLVSPRPLCRTLRVVLRPWTSDFQPDTKKGLGSSCRSQARGWLNTVAKNSDLWSFRRRPEPSFGLSQ